MKSWPLEMRIGKYDLKTDISNIGMDWRWISTRSEDAMSRAAIEVSKLLNVFSSFADTAYMRRPRVCRQ